MPFSYATNGFPFEAETGWKRHMAMSTSIAMPVGHLNYLVEAQEPIDINRLGEHLPYAWIVSAVQATGVASIRRHLDSAF
jgi:hypothetical protein